MKNSIGIDIGGTNISAVLSDEAGNIIDTFNRKSDYYGSNYLKNIEEIIKKLIEGSNIEIFGIGIGVPGIVDNIKGNVIACPALSWKNLNLKDYIEDVFGIRTFVENDVNSWTIAEKYLGVATNCDNFVMITIGTGIGCGIFLNGKIYRGNTFEAGEVGYLPLSIDAYKNNYSYNDFGFFESRASASAASQSYTRHAKQNIGCKEVFHLAKKGDAAASKIIEEVYNYLGLGISSIICLLNPEVIIIGGGMAEQGDAFLHNISKRVKQLIPISSKISLSKVGINGGSVGCALSTFINLR